ncbi:MAG: hypothetical protein AMXMBFR64_37600 [Myxococcales bacterium]
MTRPVVSPRRADKRWDKSRLDVFEALADAWLRLVEGAADTVIAEPGPAPDARHVPRLLGRRPPDGRPIAVLPGAHVRWLLGRKGGFSVTEQTLRELLTLLDGPSGPARLQVWDLQDPLPDELIDKLQVRVGVTIERFGPDRLEEVVRCVGQRLVPGGEDLDNWLLRAWMLLRRFPAAWPSALDARDEHD